ncbi:MAG: glucosaminidase domain-containing protein [Oscillospiraceae bacterium]|nr:glucosaminidase domain-containing protein [Oscillospiraceae bacterium]
MKRFISLILTVFLCVSAVNATAAGNWQNQYPWAVTSVEYCMNNGIISGDEYGNLDLGGNLTRAQMARIFTDAFDLQAGNSTGFSDVKTTDWFYNYSVIIKNSMPKKESAFNGGEYVTREEFAATLVKSSGIQASESHTIYSFNDSSDIDEAYISLLETAVVNNYMYGDNGSLRPKDLLTRAEACCFLYRVICPDSMTSEVDTTPEMGTTPIMGSATVTVEQAQRWAQSKGAAQRFIDVAPYYWYYGEQSGIRPEVMYAQAGKETGYGKYGGAVLPEMNNWAGIKIKNPEGDRTEDHETFATPEDGVRAHFNHMSAYVGVDPIGEPHDRYYVVKSIAWAGTIRYVEELGGRWCPDVNYGNEILVMIDNMLTY